MKKQEHISGIPQVRRSDGRLTTDDVEAAKLLLDTKFPQDDCLSLINDAKHGPRDDVPVVTDLEIARLLKKAKNRSAPGLDGIKYRGEKAKQEIPSAVTSYVHAVFALVIVS